MSVHYREELNNVGRLYCSVIHRCWVQAFDDSTIVREQHYSLSVQCRRSGGKTDMDRRILGLPPWTSRPQCNVSANRLIKPNTAWHRVIQEHYLHLYSGYYTSFYRCRKLNYFYQAIYILPRHNGTWSAAEYWIPILAPYNVNVGNVSENYICTDYLFL